MGVRTNSEIVFQIGRNNALSDLLLNESLTSLLDTLDHATVHEATLTAGETNYVVPFGDVAQARLVYVRANGAIRLTPGGGLATSASREGSGGSYPTGFTGTGENLDLEIDGLSVTLTFTAGASTLADVIAEINAAAVAVPVVDGAGDPVTIARNNGSGELELRSTLTGTSSTVEVLATTAAAVLAALGLTAGLTTGVNASPGQTPVTLTKPAYTAGTADTSGVPVFGFLTLQTSAITVDNLESTADTRIMVAVAGDVLTEPPEDC